MSLQPLPELLSRADGSVVRLADLEELGPAAQFTVNVTNHGSQDSDDVVRGFFVAPTAGEDGVPLKQLFGFERVHVKAGETVAVELSPAWTDFTQLTKAGTRYPLSGLYAAQFGEQPTGSFTEEAGAGARQGGFQRGRFAEHHFEAQFYPMGGAEYWSASASGVHQTSEATEDAPGRYLKGFKLQ
jgi:hypothetical protein